MLHDLKLIRNAISDRVADITIWVKVMFVQK